MELSEHDAEHAVREMSRSFSGEFEPKSYVLEMPAVYGDGLDRKWNVMKIRPANVSREDMVRMYAGAGGFSYTMGYAVLFAEPGETESAFLIRAAANGMSPELRLLEDGDYNTLDFSDLVTGKSLVESRRKAVSGGKRRG